MVWSLAIFLFLRFAAKHHQEDKNGIKVEKSKGKEMKKGLKKKRPAMLLSPVNSEAGVERPRTFRATTWTQSLPQAAKRLSKEAVHTSPAGQSTSTSTQVVAWPINLL